MPEDDVMISFTVPGGPKGKGRHRTTRTGHSYTPHDTVLYENQIKACFMQNNHQRGDYTGSVEISITAFMSIPKSASKKRQKLMEEDRVFPTKKPDADNILKAVEDALNGIAWKDDSQIVSASISKRYDHNPRLSVVIWYTDEEGRNPP